MNQMIVSLLNRLGLKSDPQTSVVFRNTVEKVTREQLSEFDGPISFDFTETLSLHSGSDLQLGNDPTVHGINKGDMIGFVYKEGDDELFSGVIDGVNEILIPFTKFRDRDSEIRIKIHTTGFKDLDSGDLVASTTGKLVFPAELGGAEQLLISPIQAVFTESDDTVTTYGLRVDRTIGSNSSKFQLRKRSTDSDKNVTGVILEMDSDTEGMRTSGLSPDPSASVHRFENEEGDSILDLINEAIQSDVLLANDFADDAAAATGDVPVGGLYHNAGALRIRIA